MHSLALNWGWFLALAVGLYLSAMISQLLTIKKGISLDFTLVGLLKRFGFTAALAVAGSVSGILFLIGVVANFMGR